MAKVPDCKWAQRKDKLFLTINVANLDKDKTTINVTDKAFSFSGGGFELKFDFFGEVNPEECKWAIGGRDVSVVLARKEEGEYWDKLQKGAKIATLKVDWDKWKDEDEVGDDDDFDTSGMGGMGGMGGGGMGGMDMAQMMAQMGGGGMGGMGGMGGGMGGPGGMDMASMMAQMGGMQGMGGGAPDSDDDDDDDDDEIPGLEADDGTPAP